MGKKTDATIKAMNAKLGELNKTCLNLAKLAEAMEKNNSDWDRHASEIARLPDYTQHPVAKARELIWGKGREMRKRLQDDMNAFNNDLSDFRKFVKKKEASKNPFKSKKSLPLAKQAIDEFAASSAMFNAVFVEAGQVFR